MANYILDTNVLVGYTFLQNRWQAHTKRLIATDNTLYIGETVLYEYCVKEPGREKEEVNLNWSYESGNYAEEKTRLRRQKRLCKLELATWSDADIDPESVAEVFIDEFDVEEQVQDKIKNYFHKKLDASSGVGDAEDCIDELIHKIRTVAEDRKQELENRVTFKRRQNDVEYPEINSRLTRIIEGGEAENCPDADVLCDALDLKEQYLVDSVVTGDKGDIHSNKDVIKSITGLNIVYLKNRFANE